MNKRRGLLAIFLLTSFNCFCQEQQKDVPPKGAVQLAPSEIKWADGPAALPKGAKISVLYGDTKTSGLFAIRLKFPPDAVVKPHIHTEDEVVTVIEGDIAIGFGEQLDPPKARTFSAGGFYVIPARTYHFVSVGKKGATIQINSNGPWTVEFK
jgi:quercetin dioxygenase-like cupin family protein